ncbi:helix-turn-helix domain-containing protein [uncultured Anaerococcus sp.]|uniref:helix-turn-helix domain-containing protein n=1 Tax=uncultured Anaerococcus sp. TaxID=293428 RepID=UPI0025CBFA72|nr:helix-turn-helix domain-containing protein [uncultured Anaerococcus sp.]
MTVNYYTILPAEIRLDKRLLPYERLLFSDILALSSIKGYCYASNKYFAKIYQVSTVSISSWISKLVDLGYVGRVYDYKENTRLIEKRRLYVKEDFMIYIKKLKDPHKADLKGGIKGDFKENTINMNNIKNNKKPLKSFEKPTPMGKKSSYFLEVLDNI